MRRAVQPRKPTGTPTGGQWTGVERAHADLELAGETALELAGQPIPVVSFETLWHVGDLDPAGKGSDSYEGKGLSVSLHPEDWASIARLGGPTWQFERAGNAFCDYHALSADQRDAIEAWGVDRGYVERAMVHEVRWYDDEWDETFSTLMTDEEEAHLEAEDRDGSVNIVSALVATSDFPDRTVRAGDINPHEVLTTLWVAEETDMDGVWWEDRYDPDRLSAPRGVIRPDRVSDWTVLPTR